MNDLVQAIENLTDAIETSAVNSALAVTILGQAIARQPGIDVDRFISDLLALSSIHERAVNREQLKSTIEGPVSSLKKRT